MLLYIILFPLISSTIIRLRGISNRKIAGWIGCTSILVSFLLVLSHTSDLFFTGDSGSHYFEKVWDWALIPGVPLSFGLRLDALSYVMCLLITFVGLLIHVYSLGYMKVKEYGRYFSYLNLFVALMLLLVLSDQLLFMFIGWEGVGLCSFLLIGFYHESHKNMNAAKKAFIVNRIGDLGLFLAMIILLGLYFVESGELTLSVLDLESRADILSIPALGPITMMSLIGILLFIGVCGKSAQMPLYIWLPDAMAGPTPVSALIHAASMVTAGIYLMSRMHFVYEGSVFVSNVVMWVGVITALFGSTVAIFQRDIKKILAFSTVSQLGYMTLACGIGAFGMAMFHVLTHGVFKALLFLCAGDIIKASNGNQDIYQMGQLRKTLPKTHIMFWIGALSLAGIFPFAGYFSKDQILFAIFSHNTIVYFLAVLGVICTSFYIFRLLYLVFYGDRQGPSKEDYVTPTTMLYPMAVLSVLALVIGWMWTPAFMHGSTMFPTFMSTVVPVDLEHHSIAKEIIVGLISITFALAGFFFARKFFVKGPKADLWIAKRYPGFYRLLSHQYYLDELYHKAFVFDEGENKQGFTDTALTNSFFHFVSVFKGLIDRYIIDALVHWFAWLPQFLGSIYTRIQNGQIQHYIRWITMGSLLVLFYWFLWVSGTL